MAAGATLLFMQQPYFLPWLGYFAKVRKADRVVFLDQSNYRRNHLSRTGYLNEFGVRSWLSLPVGASQHQLLTEIMVPDAASYLISFRRKIKQSYKEAAFFDEGMAHLDEVFEILKMSSGFCLAKMNKNVFLRSYQYFFRDDGPVFYSDLEIGLGRDRDQRVLDAAEALSCDSIILGDGGSTKIHDLSLFQSSGLLLKYLPFSKLHPTYTQWSTKEFVSGLSYLDALFNVGRIRVADMIESVNFETLP